MSRKNKWSIFVKEGGWQLVPQTLAGPVLVTVFVNNPVSNEMTLVKRCKYRVWFMKWAYKTKEGDYCHMIQFAYHMQTAHSEIQSFFLLECPWCLGFILRGTPRKMSKHVDASIKITSLIF